MAEIIQMAGSLGVGAFLGTIIFLMYRRDRLASEKRLSGLLKEDQETRAEHTKVIAELNTFLRIKNGHRKR